MSVTRSQVFDLPPTSIRVTEHQMVTRHCGCGTDTAHAVSNTNTLPRGARQGVRLGETALPESRPPTGGERGRREVGGTRPTAEFPDLFTVSVGLRGLEP